MPVDTRSTSYGLKGSSPLRRYRSLDSLILSPHPSDICLDFSNTSFNSDNARDGPTSSRTPSVSSSEEVLTKSVGENPHDFLALKKAVDQVSETVFPASIPPCDSEGTMPPVTVEGPTALPSNTGSATQTSFLESSAAAGKMFFSEQSGSTTTRGSVIKKIPISGTVKTSEAPAKPPKENLGAGKSARVGNARSKGQGPSTPGPQLDADGFQEVSRKSRKEPRELFPIDVHNANGKPIPWTYLRQFAASLGRSLGYQPECIRRNKGSEATFFVFDERHANISRTYYEEYGLVKGRRHKTLRGLVGGLPLDLDHDEILQECKSVGVTGVTPLRPVQAYRMKKAFSRKAVLSFEGIAKLPERVRIGPLCLDVRPYVESKQSCFRCGKPGHYANVCRARQAQQAKPVAPRDFQKPKKPAKKTGEGISYAEAVKPKTTAKLVLPSEFRRGENRDVRFSDDTAGEIKIVVPAKAKSADKSQPKKPQETAKTASKAAQPAGFSKSRQAPQKGNGTKSAEQVQRSTEKDVSSRCSAGKKEVEAADLEQNAPREIGPETLSAADGSLEKWLDDSLRFLATFHGLQAQRLVNILRYTSPQVAEEIVRCIDLERSVTVAFARSLEELTAFMIKAIDVAQPQVV